MQGKNYFVIKKVLDLPLFFAIQAAFLSLSLKISCVEEEGVFGGGGIWL